MAYRYHHIMEPLLVSGIAHPPPCNKSDNDLAPSVFQSNDFISQLKRCKVTADSNHANTEKAGRMVLASGLPVTPQTVAPMIDYLANQQDNIAKGTVGQVVDAWVGSDGALRTTLQIDGAGDLTKRTIQQGILSGISISHHEDSTGKITPFEIGLCHRPLRNGCFVRDVNTPKTYKAISKLTMASAATETPVEAPPATEAAPVDTPMETDQEATLQKIDAPLREFAETMTMDMDDSNREKAIDQYTHMYKQYAALRDRYAKEEAEKLELQKQELQQQRALLEGAAAQLGRELTDEEKRMWESIGNLEPKLLAGASEVFVTAARSHKDKQGYRMSSRAIGILNSSFGNVEERRVGEKTTASTAAAAAETSEESARSANVNRFVNRIAARYNA